MKGWADSGTDSCYETELYGETEYINEFNFKLSDMVRRNCMMKHI